MSSSSTAPPAGGNVDVGPRLLAVTWVFVSVATVFLSMRFFVRYYLTGPAWWDDFVLLFSWTADMTMAVLRTIYARAGYARHDYYLDPQQTILAAKYSWITLGLAIMAHSTGRISVALLMYRIQGKCRWRTIFLFTIIGLLVATAFVGTCLDCFQCRPPKALWDTYLADQGRATCIDGDAVDRYFIGGASFWCSTDFMLAALPITIVWNLNLSLRKKVGVSMLLGLGVVAGICAIFKIYYLRNLLIATDHNWVDQPLYLFDTIEINVIIIAASTATLRPLYLYLFNPKGKGSDIRRQRKGLPVQVESRHAEIPQMAQPAIVAAPKSRQPNLLSSTDPMVTPNGMSDSELGSSFVGFHTKDDEDDERPLRNESASELPAKHKDNSLMNQS